MSKNYRYIDKDIQEIDITEEDTTVRADVDLEMTRDKKYPYPTKKCCEHIQGNLTDIKVKNDDCEIRADIEVDRRKTVRVWGQVKDCYGKPVNCALIKLIKEITSSCGSKKEYVGVAHTVTDCMGFYQFDVCCPRKDGEKYRILVGKAAVGEERVVERQKCEVCKCGSGCDCID